MKLPDLWTAGAIGALGIFLILQAQGFPQPVGGASPRLFPRIIGGTLILLGAAIALRDLTGGAPRLWPARPEWSHDRRAVARVVYIPAGIIVFLSAAPTGGAIPVGAAIVAGFSLLWRERVVTALVFGVILVAVFYAFFTQVMRVPLPMGPLSLPF